MGFSERIQRFEDSLKKREPEMRAIFVGKITDKVRYMTENAWPRHIEGHVQELGDILAAGWAAGFEWVKTDPSNISPEEKKRVVNLMKRLRAIGDSKGCYMLISEILDEILTDIVNHDVIQALGKKSSAG